MLPRRRRTSLSPRYLLDVAVQTIFHSVRTSSPGRCRADDPTQYPFSETFLRRWVSRSASSFSVDVFVQTPVRSNVLHDAATQLPLTEFFIGCIYSNDPLDRQNSVRQSPPPVQGPRALAAAAARTRTASPAS